MMDVKHGYKSKTIKAVLRKKLEDWFSTIEDDELRDKMRKNVIVTGGCIASMLLGDKVNDFDVYFRDKETTIAVAEYYVGRFSQKDHKGVSVPISVQVENDRVGIVVKSAGIASEEGTVQSYAYFEGRPDNEGTDYVSAILQDPGEIVDIEEEILENLERDADTVSSKPRYRPVFMSTNAITLSDRVQIILRFYGDADEIHKNFDYVHCTSYYTGWDGNLVLRPAALEALLSRELKYVGSKYPICSLIRMRKFIRRGWSINAGQILKMVLQISELDLSKVEVLKDQLIGVDVAYFNQVISRLKENDPEKVNTAYLVEIIDRMF